MLLSGLSPHVYGMCGPVYVRLTCRHPACTSGHNGSSLACHRFVRVFFPVVTLFGPAVTLTKLAPHYLTLLWRFRPTTTLSGAVLTASLGSLICPTSPQPFLEKNAKHHRIPPFEANRGVRILTQKDQLGKFNLGQVKWPRKS